MPTLEPVVIIDNYDSFSYNLLQMVQMETDAPVEIYRNNMISFEALCVLKPQRIILSPGPGHPGNADDFGICGEIIERQKELDCPVLGVCLGHQGIAHYLGGTVAGAPEIVHGESRMMNIVADSPLFNNLPESFEAMRYHSLQIEEETLPAQLRITVRDAASGIPMAIQHTKQPLYGIQFHPESIGTPEGRQIIRNFLQC